MFGDLPKRLRETLRAGMSRNVLISITSTPWKVCMSPSTALDEVSPAQHARRLTDDVLQSAEEAVLANPASADVAPDLEALPARLPAQAPAWSRYEGALARKVASKPLASALIAIGAGALAAAVLRSLVIRRMR